MHVQHLALRFMILAVATTGVASDSTTALAGASLGCLADIAPNGTVDGADLGEMLGSWGECGTCAACQADLDGDCQVNGADLGILLGSWGDCPVPLDIAVESVQLSPDPIVEGDEATVDVTLSNSGAVDELVTVVATVSGDSGSCTNTLVPAGGTALCTVLLQAPSVPTACGGTTPFPVNVVAQVDDVEPSNDSGSATMHVRPRYWDLRFMITNEPSTAGQCDAISWKIKVTNVGTEASEDVCFVTGINCSPGAGEYSWNLGLKFQSTGIVQPDDSETIVVGNYFIACGAQLGMQWIKVEIDYSAWCFDDCGTGNFDQEPITITP